MEYRYRYINRKMVPLQGERTHSLYFVSANTRLRNDMVYLLYSFVASFIVISFIVIYIFLLLNFFQVSYQEFFFTNPAQSVTILKSI